MKTMAKLQESEPAKLSKSGPKANISAVKLKSQQVTLAMSSKSRKEATGKRARAVKEELDKQALDMTNYKDGVRVLYEVHLKTSENKKQLLDDVEESIFLQIIGIKIPKCREHTLRIDLPHSCYPNDTEICFISADLPNTNLRDYDKVTDHYESLLKAQGVSSIKTILSFHQLRNEYQEFEMKRKLVSAYNIFLADSKIHGKVVHFLGNTFAKAHKVPRVLTFDKHNIKAQIERILAQTDLKIHNKGNSTGIKVGIIGMKEEHVLDNVKAVTTELSSIYPGGSENIRSISIKTTKSMAVPLYLTLKMKGRVEIPKLDPKRPKKNVSYTDDLSTLLNTQVTVLPNGYVKTRLIKKGQSGYQGMIKNESVIITNQKSKIQPDFIEQQQSDTNESEDEDINIDTKEEQASLTLLGELKQVLETVTEVQNASQKEEDMPLQSNVDNKVEIISTSMDNSNNERSAKRRRRSKSKNTPKKVQAEEHAAEPTTPSVSKTPKGPKEILKAKMTKKLCADDTTAVNVANADITVSTPKLKTDIKLPSQSNATPKVINETPKTPRDKRKSTSIDTGSKKKLRVIKNPFYNGSTPQ